jgi:hypothetical protein
VERGLGPASHESEKSARKLLAVLDKIKDVKGTGWTRRRSFTTDWWTEQFKLMDFLPKCASSVVGGGGVMHLY